MLGPTHWALDPRFRGGERNGWWPSLDPLIPAQAEIQGNERRLRDSGPPLPRG